MYVGRGELSVSYLLREQHCINFTNYVISEIYLPSIYIYIYIISRIDLYSPNEFVLKVAIESS